MLLIELMGMNDRLNVVHEVGIFGSKELDMVWVFERWMHTP